MLLGPRRVKARGDLRRRWSGELARLSPDRVDAERPAASRCEEEEREAVNDRELAVVDDGKELLVEPALPVKLHVRDGHRAASDERRARVQRPTQMSAPAKSPMTPPNQSSSTPRMSTLPST